MKETPVSEAGSVCPHCGNAFVCGMAAGQDSCWCTALPPAMVVPPVGAGCYCPECLRELVAAKSTAR